MWQAVGALVFSLVVFLFHSMGVVRMSYLGVI
jgi:hypothetical protein